MNGWQQVLPAIFRMGGQYRQPTPRDDPTPAKLLLPDR